MTSWPQKNPSKPHQALFFCQISTFYLHGMDRYGIMEMGDIMRLGWAKKGNSISYYVHKTIRVDGKNKSLVIKRFGSEKFICDTHGVTDAKAWAKE